MLYRKQMHRLKNRKYTFIIVNEFGKFYNYGKIKRSLDRNY